MMQAIIAESAIEKVEAVGPDQIVRFIIRLNDGQLRPVEIEILRRLGMTEFLPFVGQASVAIPARHLLELAELATVVQVF